jgi:nucleotide-binding universal stress UspA family protein
LNYTTREIEATMNVLVAVDLDPGSDKVLGFAAMLANETGGEVHAVHVISKLEKEDRGQTPGQSQYIDVMLEETKRGLEKSLRDLGVAQSSITAIALTGEPVDEIQRVATEDGVDVLVIGMRRRSRVGKFLLGSDLQELLLASDRPIVVVPMGAFD